MTEPDGTTDRRVESALERAFPHREIDEVAPGGISWNDQNETVRVDFSDGGAAYLKVAVNGDASRIVRELAVVEYVDARCDVAVPTVVASDPSASPPYLATAPMDEENLAERWADASTEKRVREVREIGAAYAEIHSRSFESHGHVVGGEGTELRLDTGSWTEVLLDVIESIRERASSDRFSTYFDAVKVAVREHRDTLDEAPATLVHGDPAQPNLFYGDTVGFIDWEIAHVGDPVRELNRAERQLIRKDADELVPALREGYRGHPDSEPLDFESRTPIYDAIWHLNRLSAFEKEVQQSDTPAEELAASREEEMERLLENIS